MLKGKTAAITGGTRGIGFATAKKFLENGANVAVFGSRRETVENALTKLKEINPDWPVIGMAPDLTDPMAVQSVLNDVRDHFGSLDIMVNNAGISARDSIYDYKPEEFAKIIDLNVNSVFYCSKAAAEIMKVQGGGVILNTSSMVSLYGQATGSGYPTSKFAVNGMTKSLARELGKDNIRVNAVAPGAIKTDMAAAVPEEMLKPLIRTIPLGRMGEPEEIADAFLFLASDMASYITGTILSVDGAAMT